MPFTYLRRAAVAVAVLAAAGCTIKNSTPPPLAGPSGLALTLTVNATPDSISQDGGSQSSVRITAIGPDGQPVAGLPLRLDMFVNGVPQDFGTLSARSVVTNNAGVATAVFTAPAGPPNGVFGTCSGLPGNCVSIVATPTSTNFTTANPEQVQIRLVPTGVILPPAGLPTADFFFSPTTVSANAAVQFDASSSAPGTGATQITSYSWNFGDGTTGSGQTISHPFGTGNSFVVTLTVTNDRGLSASKQATVPVTPPTAPVADFVFGPVPVHSGSQVNFTSTSTTSNGAAIISYNWSFGDQQSCSNATCLPSAASPTHSYSGVPPVPPATTNTVNYNVTLTIRDSNNLTSTKTISVPVTNP